MKKIWEIFPSLVKAVRDAHIAEGMTGSGHDFEHAARVGQYAYLVTHEDSRYAEVAGAAGLCHNADRVLQKRLGVGRRDIPKDEIRNLVLGWIFTSSFTVDERDAIVDAVLKHDGINSSSDSPVLIGLMDADRLVNIELDLVIRCGQFQPDLPAVDFVHLLNDPAATYREPKSVLRDISSSLEWETDPRFALRNPKAIEMGRERFAILRSYVVTLTKQIHESGLVPYPFV